MKRLILATTVLMGVLAANAAKEKQKGRMK